MTACMIADTVVHVMHESSLRRIAVWGSVRQTGLLSHGGKETEEANL